MLGLANAERERIALSMKKLFRLSGDLKARILSAAQQSSSTIGKVVQRNLGSFGSVVVQKPSSDITKLQRSGIEIAGV